jgi:hypothetical protein
VARLYPLHSAMLATLPSHAGFLTKSCRAPLCLEAYVCPPTARSEDPYGALGSRSPAFGSSRCVTHSAGNLSRLVCLTAPVPPATAASDISSRNFDYRIDPLFRLEKMWCAMLPAAHQSSRGHWRMCGCLYHSTSGGLFDISAT